MNMSSLPPHPLNTSEQEYVDQMSAQDRALHELAIKKLGSSYFVKWTHGYKKWAKAKATVTPQPIHNTPTPATK